MAYIQKKNLANPGNYGGRRDLDAIKYIVIHYTANDGDTDESNGAYFHNNVVKASAHYFVDDDSVTVSVNDEFTAWSVGGKKYPDCVKTGGGKYYGKCTNANSISIELCDDVKNGRVYPSAGTIANAIELVKKLMKKYGIPAANVIRHFDVNGKPCPAYWCGTSAKDKQWKTEFWDKLNGNVEFKPYLVRVTENDLNVRKGPGVKYDIVKKVQKGEVFTIIGEEMNGTTKWLKLKSGIGYISAAYTEKV